MGAFAGREALQVRRLCMEGDFCVGRILADSLSNINQMESQSGSISFHKLIQIVTQNGFISLEDARKSEFFGTSKQFTWQLI